MSEDRPARVAGGAAATPTTKNGEWTGQLQRGADEGTVRGWLHCQATGGRIEFTGVKDPRPGTGYLLLGKLVPV